MPLAHVTDHEAQALARLAQQFESSTNLRALVSAGAGSVQTAEDVLWALFTERLLDGAAGAQLDNLGAVVGQLREASTDDQYRARIRGRILANRSDNSVEAILGIVRAVLDDPNAFATLTQYAPAAFLVEVTDDAIDTDTATALAALIRVARAAGVGAGLITSGLAPDATFTFADPVAFLNANTASGAATLVASGSVGHFPATGFLRVGEGTAVGEEIEYSSRAGSTFTLVGTTFDAHEAGDSLALVPTSEMGFGDEADGSVGGALAGILPA
jgi:hypothetical protein